MDALQKEISLQGHFIPSSEKIDSIYFGGGTPSLLKESELALIMEALHRKFTVTADAEITLEANPDDVTKRMVKEWMHLGINRLSLGIQSFNEAELQWMNRAHTAAESLKSIDEIQDAGMDNFSVDLIFGSPVQTNAILEENAAIIINRNIPHISCYALTVEPRTALHKMVEVNRSLQVDADKQATQFLLLLDLLQQNGYEQYEISNYAKPGMRSKHNSSYWEGKAYYGFGPSAHSFDGVNRRRWNVSNNALYIQQLSHGQIPYEEEVLTQAQQLNEYIMTALRTTEGINTVYVAETFGAGKLEKLMAAGKTFIESGRIMITGNNSMALTREGKLFADGIAAALFF